MAKFIKYKSEDAFLGILMVDGIKELIIKKIHEENVVLWINYINGQYCQIPFDNAKKAKKLFDKIFKNIGGEIC